MQSEMLKNYFIANVSRCIKLESTILRDKWREQHVLKHIPIPPTAFFGVISGVIYPMQGLIHIPHIDLSVGMKCSLKCKYCTQWNPYIDEPQIYSADEIINCVRHLLKNVDYIHQIALMGGEVFLNKEWDKVLDFLLLQKKVGRVLVITNATVFPQIDALEKLKNSKVEIWIDNYGNRSRYAKKLCNYCNRNRIKYRYENAKIWWDIGTLQGKRLQKTTEIKETWDDCWIRNCAAFIEGKLYRCSRQWVLENNNLEAPSTWEFVDVRGGGKKQERNAPKIISFLWFAYDSSLCMV